MMNIWTNQAIGSPAYACQGAFVALTHVRACGSSLADAQMR